MTKKERMQAVTERLKQVYPEAVCALHYTHDYELLFATRLSAQCTDARVNIVTEKLFSDFPTLESFAEASEEEIAEDIRSCGLFRTKARDLHACAVVLLAEYGGRVPDTMEELLRLPGVGRKTANLILGDIFGKPAIVCDTHCIRLSNRLGFVRDEKDPVKVERRCADSSCPRSPRTSATASCCSAGSTAPPVRRAARTARSRTSVRRSEKCGEKYTD